MLETRGASRHQADIRAAIRTSHERVRVAKVREEPDFSLCHGLTGVAECLLAASQAVGDDEARDTALTSAASWCRSYAMTPELWPCGVARGTNPSLMLGLAGIGYFYLRLADGKVPSVLLPADAEPLVRVARPGLRFPESQLSGAEQQTGPRS